jgi:hypothetical protein
MFRYFLQTKGKLEMFNIKGPIVFLMSLLTFSGSSFGSDLICDMYRSIFPNDVVRRYESLNPSLVLGEVWASTPERAEWIGVWKRASYPNIIQCRDFAARHLVQKRLGEVVRYLPEDKVWRASVESIIYIDGNPVSLADDFWSPSPCGSSESQAKNILVNSTAKRSSDLCPVGDGTKEACRNDLIAKGILYPLTTCTLAAPANGKFIRFNKN